MNLELVTAPTAEPLTLAEAKTQLRVDTNADDKLITALVKAAREVCEAFSGRAYITRTYRLTLDRFPAYQGAIRLPYPPAQSVSSIKYHDADGTEQTLDPAEYELLASSTPALVVPAVGSTWPSTQSGKLGAVRVEYVAGYGDTSDTLPEVARQAVRIKVADLYEHRESEQPGTLSRVESVAVEALLWPTRVVYQE